MKKIAVACLIVAVSVGIAVQIARGAIASVCGIFVAMAVMALLT